ncbi:MAG: glucose 1-dehydrogenase [Bdellovibrionota bacterium]
MSELKLKNKVAVITGGNSGIGLATAREFKAQGASVVISGRDEKTLFDAARELGGDTLAVRGDVSKLADIDTLIAKVKERFGRIDILFANAGVGIFAPSLQTDEAAFDTMFDINVKGLYFTVTKSFPLLSQGASIILTSSVANEMGNPIMGAYSATKAAVRSLTRSFAAEFVNAGIRVNALSPGPIETPIFSRGDVSPQQVQAMKDSLVATTPMKRLGTSEEMAKVALFLASSDSSYITGIDLKADGGKGQF